MGNRHHARVRPKRTKLFIGGSLLVVGVFLFMRFISHREPSYNGKYLSEWLMIYRQHEKAKDAFYDEAREAVRAIGKDAVPCLTRWLNTRSPHWNVEVELWLNRITGQWPKFPKPPKYYRTDPVGEVSLQRDRVVADGFEILGTNGASAVSELARIALTLSKKYAEASADPSAGASAFNSSGTALGALTAIGRSAMPSLFSIATNQNAPIWKDAFRWIYIGHTNEAPIIPALVNCLTNANSEMAVWAAVDLGIGGFEMNAALPICSNLMKNSDPEIRRLAVYAVGCYGSQASAYEAEVKAAIHDPDERVRKEATTALEKIAPTTSVLEPAP
jgi:hypothetical protein